MQTLIPYFTNTHLKPKAEKIRAAQLAGKLIFGNNGNKFGLPDIEKIPEVRYERINGGSGYGYVCKWGILVFDPTLDQYVFNPNNGSIPENVNIQPLELVSAHLEMQKKRITIQSNGTTITLEDIPAWRDGYGLCEELNKELQHNQHLPWFVTDLTWDGNPKGCTPLFSGNKVRFSTGNASGTLTGFALDKEKTSDNIPHLLYAGVVGYKTMLESIRATMQANKRQKKILNVGRQTCLAHHEQYKCFYSPLPNVNAHHMCAITRTAMPGQWQFGDLSAYLLRFEGEEKTLPQMLWDRLNEATTLPILKEWAEILWDTASDDPNLVCSITTDGDCTAGYWINLNEELWAKLLQTLLENSTISL